ncbi:hypothetical protein V202x_45200 [Gimesia aquarii]|uniref:Uncharacterized protein n=1 Tax=Gimesia aquarii TaxID=2527964 RepID=A0A517X0T0_9PLAN|nr:hypothetical protein V202x_45200 [Gimesia aquarii]
MAVSLQTAQSGIVICSDSVCGLIEKHVQLSRAKALHRVHYPHPDYLHDLRLDSKYARYAYFCEYGND